MQRLRLDIAYDGTDFKGWQKQSGQDVQTVQGALERALKKLTTEDISTCGSGRTDAGVHALMQVVHFDLPSSVNLEKIDWKRGLNRFLPPSVRIQEVFQSPQDFHALKSATSKVYRYQFQSGGNENPTASRYALWQQSPLDVDYLNGLSQPLIGRHDFESFQTAGTELATTVRNLYKIEWSQGANNIVYCEIEGNGFLKQMVRNIVGTLTHRYWSKELKPQDIQGILDKKSRSAAFGTAPALGLCLTQVKYPAELDKKCIKS